MTQHFATLEGDALAAAMLERFKRFSDNLVSSRDLERMEDMSLAYYGEDREGHSTARTDAVGDRGESRSLKANHLRNTIRNKLTLATSERPGLKPVPVNTDTQSINQAELAKGALEYYFTHGRGYQECDAAAEMAECMGWAWVDVMWDAFRGAVVEKRPTVDESGAVVGTRTVREGDIVYKALMPVDVAFDFETRNKELDWLIVRHWVNKFELAAQVLETTGDEDVAEEIRNLSVGDEFSRLRLLYGRQGADFKTDEIPVYELRQRDTCAVPGGRMARLVGTNIFLPTPVREGMAEGQNPYEDLGCYRINAGERFGTARGYTSAHDILGLQIAVDVLTSIPYSNERALGGNVIAALEGSGLRAETIKKALTVLYYQNPNQKPEVLNMLRTAPEVFDFRGQLISEMGNLEGMDALSMGREERQLSGAAMALLDSRTQRSVGSLVVAHTDLIGAVANATIRRIFMFGRRTRKIPMIMGKTKQARLMAMNPQDLAGIYRVEPELLSPLMRAVSGRVEVAKDLLGSRGPDGKPAINAQQYIAVIETGRLEPMTEAPMAELNNIRAENERLLKGEALEQAPELDPLSGQPLPGPDGMPVEPIQTAMVTDNHFLHCQEHAAVASSPEVRANPTIMRNLIAHQMAHVQLWQEADPALLKLLGIPSPLEVMPMMAPPQGPPPEDGAPRGDAGSPQPPGDMPNMPINPSTGERFSPTGEIPNA